MKIICKIIGHVYFVTEWKVEVSSYTNNGEVKARIAKCARCFETTGVSNNLI